jgi:hypothetical protein
MDARGRSNDPNAADVRVAAVTAGVPDVFVLRRVAAGRFVHLGGAGRGEGWAGIVEVTLEGEADLERALAGDEIVRVGRPDRQRVFGPYYARAAAIVPLVPDAIVVFGAPDAAIAATDEQLARAARTAMKAVGPVGPAKQLADSLELLEAVRAVAAVEPEPVGEAMRTLTDLAAASLSCELGVMYVADGDRLVVAERGWPLRPPPGALRDALASVSESHHFPFCVQDARRSPPPGPLADDPGLRSYYLLELTGPARGVLFVAHTDAAPRGFTLLCRRLGVRVAEGASVVIGAGITREWIAAEAARIEAGFAGLER